MMAACLAWSRRKPASRLDRRWSSAGVRPGGRRSARTAVASPPPGTTSDTRKAAANGAPVRSGMPTLAGRCHRCSRTSTTVSTVAFSPDGKVLATGDYSGTVHRWDVETGAMIGRPFAAGSIVLCVAFSPDGRLLAAGTADPAHQVVLWDLDSGRPRGDPVHFKGWLYSLTSARTVPTWQPVRWILRSGSSRRARGGPGRSPSWWTVTGACVYAGRLTRLDQRVQPSDRRNEAMGRSDGRAGVADDVPPGRDERRRGVHPGLHGVRPGYWDGSVRLWDVATARQIGPGWKLRRRADP